MSYINTFITVSEDATVTSAIVPLPRNNKPTIASIEYELISQHPYEYTEADVQFKTYLLKNQIGERDLQQVREQFFEKPKACFRASPLVKQYGWGIHYDDEGKIALYEIGSEAYEEFLDGSSTITILKGMRSKRK
ncbi:DUF6157 family protein [Halalkalibacter oceani]|uniref:DUF6157 family protein n=1 Tax=Halalkalibacter oceani TaxID=1653776 RepID=A0A9X2DR03_9BACI|nr:DUF6157 family protein [Halalkalibacter oceani]MCM3714873.1 DUF6157 family protein [Halalkalibacter oceani]